MPMGVYRYLRMDQPVTRFGFSTAGVWLGIRLDRLQRDGGDEEVKMREMKMREVKEVFEDGQGNEGDGVEG